MSSLFILLSAICWGGYAVYAEFAHTTSVLGVVFYSQVAATIFSMFFSRDIVLSIIASLKPSNLGWTAVISVTPVLHQFLFLNAVKFIGVGAALFVFELWPIILLFVAPFIGIAAVRRVTVSQCASFVLAGFGLIIIATDSLLVEGGVAAGASLGGIALGFLLAILGAVSIALTALKVFFTKNVIANNSFSGSITTNMISRLMTVPFLGAACLIWDVDFYSLPTITTGVVAGFVIHFLSPIFGDEGIRRSKSRSDFLIFFYAPFFGVAAVSIFTQSGISDIILIGGLIIVCANIYSRFFELRRVDLPFSLIATIGFIVLCYLKNSDGANVLAGVASVSTFFAIISGFLIQRLTRRTDSIVQYELRSTHLPVLNRKTGEFLRIKQNLDDENSDYMNHLNAETNVLRVGARHKLDVISISILYICNAFLCFLLSGFDAQSVIVSTAIFVSSTYLLIMMYEHSSDRASQRMISAMRNSSDVADEYVALLIGLVACGVVAIWLFYCKIHGGGIDQVLWQRLSF